MELKKRVEIRRMMKNLPGFSGGYAIGDIDFAINNPYIITQQYPLASQDIPITIPKSKPVAESTFAERGGDIITSGIGFAGSAINAFGPVKGVNEL